MAELRIPVRYDKNRKGKEAPHGASTLLTDEYESVSVSPKMYSTVNVKTSEVEDATGR